MRKLVTGVITALVMSLGFVVATVTPALAAGTCQGDAPAATVEFNDSYECLGPQYHWTQYTASYVGPSAACYNLHTPLFWDAGHPSPNGWGNAISSLHNNTRHTLNMYDGFNCTQQLFSMGPFSWYDRLIAAHNNKGSSIWLKCVRVDCS